MNEGMFSEHSFTSNNIRANRPHNVADLNDLDKFVDMFAGIGGFHFAAQTFGLQCVFASEIDPEARRAYEYNFGIKPEGDIAQIDAEDVPDHDLFCAGFPCQPFSIIGHRKGFEDTRGTLFFEIARILDVKRPRAVVLENVKQLTTLDGGYVLDRILSTLKELNYQCISWRILNALNFGLPQKRERVIIVALQDAFETFVWPSGDQPMTPLAELLEDNPDPKFMASERIRNRRHSKHVSKHKPAIWHENKGGNISSYPYSCALRANASYNYLLVDGERRLTSREMLRLQGFPDSFEIVCNDAQTRKQAGNAIPVPLARAAIKGLLDVIRTSEASRENPSKVGTVPA